MSAILKFLDGKKSWFAAGLGVLVGGLQLFGVLEPAQVTPLWGIVASLGFIGISDKGRKIADALRGAGD